MDFDTRDLPSYIPGYDAYCERLSQEDYDNDHLDFGVDEAVDEMLMAKREEDIAATQWNLIEERENYKKYVANDNPHFFRDVTYNEDGSIKSESSWKQY